MARTKAKQLDINDSLPMLGIATPGGNPPAGKIFLYAKADGKLYIKNDAGVETDLTATGAGGSAAIYQATINFGAQGVTEKTFPIADSNVTPASKILMTLAALDDTQENSGETITLHPVPLAGQIQLTALAPQGQEVRGTFKVNYQVG